VGTRAAGLLARAGADVRITALNADLGAAAVAAIEKRFNSKVEMLTIHEPVQARGLLGWAEIVLAAGPASTPLLAREIWAGQPALKVIADVNAIPPLGIEGIEPTDNATMREGIHAFGALGIGGLKMKTHLAAVARLFEKNDLVLDAEEIFDLAATL
jgi:hypothetical protein